MLPVPVLVADDVEKVDNLPTIMIKVWCSTSFCADDLLNYSAAAL
jgi:hypothetical protein